MNYKNSTSLGKNSYLLSFEGIEGSGKSTQISFLKTFLESQGFKVLCLREPGGTIFGEELRKAILLSESPIAPIAEAHLFAASRAQLLIEKIIPFLKESRHIVILDRFIDSSIAYQGFARELGAQKILDIHADFPLSFLPTKTFYLRINLETSMDRQSTRAQKKDYFEKENNKFYSDLIEGYDYCAKTFPDRISIIDASQSIEEVTEKILKEVKSII